MEIERSKYDIYRLQKSSCFNLSGNRKHGLFLSQKAEGNMIFTDYWNVLVLNFSVIGNTVFFSVKKLMERWYLHGLFELSMIFQDLGIMVFRAVLQLRDFRATASKIFWYFTVLHCQGWVFQPLFSPLTIILIPFSGIEMRFGNSGSRHFASRMCSGWVGRLERFKPWWVNR